VIDLTKKGVKWDQVIICAPARKKKRQQRKVGREEEGSSSNRPELADLSGLRLSITRHLCDNPHALFVRQPSSAKSCIKRVGESGKAALVGAPDADILLEAIEERSASKENNSRSRDVLGQGESASRRTCE